MTDQRIGHEPGCFDPECDGAPNCFPLTKRYGPFKGVQTNLMWYGLCTYWTYDWEKLTTTDSTLSGIPCCPECGAVGFQTTIEDWEHGIDKHDEKHPGYKTWFMTTREQCHGRGLTLKKLWEREKARREDA